MIIALHQPLFTSSLVHARPMVTPAIQLTMSTLLSTALSHPLDELFHLRSVFPGQREKFPCIQRRRLGPKKSFKSPPNVRTLPRIQPISARDDPVVAKCLKHSVCQSSYSCIAIHNLNPQPSAQTHVHAPAASWNRAFPKCPCTAAPLPSLCRLWSFHRSALARSSMPHCCAA